MLDPEFLAHGEWIILITAVFFFMVYTVCKDFGGDDDGE